MIAQILQNSLIPTFVIDHKHILTHWNTACERLTGIAASTVVGTKNQWLAFYRTEKPVMADLIVKKASKEILIEHFGTAVTESTIIAGAYEAESFFSEQADHGRWIFSTAAPLHDTQGAIIGAVQTLQDITFRRQIEQALQLSENKFRAVAEFTYDWEYWIDPAGNLVYMSPSCERITGYRREEFVANPGLLAAITHPDDKVEILYHLQKEIKKDEVSHLDFRIVTRQGEEKWISHNCQPVFGNVGENLGRRASNRDITKRKRLESVLLQERHELEIRVSDRTRELSSAYARLVKEGNARKRTYDDLKESEEELRKRKEFIETILDNLPIGLAVHTLTGGKVYYMNREFTKIYGWPKDVLTSFDAFFDHVYPDPKYRKVVKKRVLRDIATRDPAKMVWKNLLPTTQTGEQRVVTVRGIPLFEQNLIISTAQDITEKQRANEALQFTRFSIDHANDMIYWVDFDGRIVDVNGAICNNLGYRREELLSMTVFDINPGLTLAMFHKDWQRIQQQENRRMETSLYCKSGEIIPVEIHTNYIAFSGREYNCVFARDISERKELERLVAIQDKMGSLGRVAAGIAHEIRNPLSTINIYLSILNRLVVGEYSSPARGADMREALAEMESASHRIEAVVKRVMDFSKPSRHIMQLQEVNCCVRNAIELSAVTIRKSGVALELKLAENLPECYLDGQLIEQLVLNLLTNAIEELTEIDGPKHLLVQTSQRSGADGKRHIVLTVADSGAGVALEMRDKIFDPFFTTKNYGSGIGLSICHRIISDHHGVLHVATSEWGGALFTAEFPVQSEAVS